MDYAFLRQEGIRHLERMTRQLWTDFNVHDPGITILEQVCYALTDLAHRINYDLQDLLASGGDNMYDSLYSPAQILTSEPVTLNDLRKLVIDVKGVKNAWVEKVEAQQIPLYFHASKNALSIQGDALTAEPVYLKGLYRVLFEISDLLGINRKDVLRQVASRLHAHRGLCEDFEEIRLLDPQEIQVHARIEIEAVEDANDVLLEIYQRSADYISPPVRFSTLSQLLEAGKRVDEIFDGPLLEHGFIDSEELSQAQRRSTLYTSDLIREIMDVPGVRAVRNISISAGGAKEAWSLKLDSDKAPKLNLKDSVISLERNQLTLSINDASVREAYYQRLRQSAAFHKLAFDERDIQPPPGRDRNVENYYSLQHQFPATYGIGAMGLPASATPRRKAQAKQLKAYLMFFDQLLANYFTQLAHVSDLFSFSGHTAHTYFSQPINDPSLGIEDIRKSDPSTHQDKLQQITENPHAPPEVASAQPDFRRRNRFLNHLLARFAEQFTDYSLILYGAIEGISGAEKLVQDKQILVQDKGAFLQDYPQISSARGTAFNYLRPWSSANSSGLEKRLRRKLGISENRSGPEKWLLRKLGIVDTEESFYIVEHILLRPMSGDTQQQSPILANTRLKDPYSLQLSFVFPNWPPRFADQGFKAFIERTIREETPAHLSLTIHWLDQPGMAAFETAYQDWLDKRRSFWQDKLGVSYGSS